MSEEIEYKIAKLKGRIKEGIPKDFIAKDILYDNYCNAIDKAVEIVSNQFVELDEDEVYKVILGQYGCMAVAKAICAKFGRKKIDRSNLLGTIARGYCSDKNKHKIIDPDLIEQIADEVIKELEG